MSWTFWRRREEELEDEVESHLRMAIEDRVARGEAPRQAEQAARRDFGNVALVNEVTRDNWAWTWLERLLQDVRYGVRMLAKAPAYTAIAMLTLGLGIGLNTALFSVIKGVLLNPLPFPHADELVGIHENKANFEGGSLSYPNFLDWQKDNHTFTAMAIARAYAFSLTGLGDAEQVNAEFVSSDFFPLLGVTPIMGRTFAPGEDRVGGAPIALVSEGFWRRKLGSTPKVIGKSMRLDSRNFTVVGVIPASFHLRIPGFREREIYVPVGQWTNSLLQSRGAGLGIHGVGRLKAGVTLAQAQADMDAVTRNLAAAFPNEDKGITANLVPLKQQIIGGVKPLLLVLFAAVGCVLLIACVNVANLLLARSSGRMREFAVRAALGASRMRVIRQLLTESCLIALAGGSVGFLLAVWGTRAALNVLPVALPRSENIGIDGQILMFTTAISVLSGILFGLVPAIKTSRTNLHDTLKEGGRGGSGVRHRAHGTLVVVETALALVLLVGAGLMIRSLSQLWKVDPGFESHNVLTFGVSLPPSMVNASPTAIRAAYREFDHKMRSIPGVHSVSQTWGAVPLSSDDEQLFWIDGQPKPASDNEMNWAIDYIVEPQYLAVMGIPLKRGRFLAEQDDEHAPHVVVVDEIFAQKYFPHEDPLGKRIHIKDNEEAAEVVGVVEHVRQWGLDADDAQSLRAQIYIPCMQMSDKFLAMASSGSQVMIRSEGAAHGLLTAIRQTSRQMSSEQVIFGTQSMDEIISDSLATRRFSMILLGAFAGLALALASVGIYGVISYLVGQRTHEIGIRMALGAERRDVLRLVVGQGGKMAGLGIVIGSIAAVGLMPLLSSFLFEVKPTDPATFLVVGGLLGMIALLACYLPARRATRIDPMVALRYE
jgi:predicted permease